jgi:hypothetical protein
MLRELRVLLHHNPAQSGTGQKISPTQCGIDRRRDGGALSRAGDAAVRISRRQFLVPSAAHNQARIEGFDKAFKSRSMEDIALLIKCRPADANRDVLSRLKEIGLVRIFMGIESATEFLLQGLRLKTELDEFRLPSRTISAGSASRSRLGRQVAATVLAIGVQAALSTGQGMAEQTPAPMQ